MTREEAIRWLESIEDKYIHGGDAGFDESRKEAIHMAIKSLEVVGDQKEEDLTADLKGQMDHYIKLNINFADQVSNGQKCFEIRKNDRGYQKGDIVVFKPVDDAGVEVYHPIFDEVYEITYVISGWGLKDGYCVFGIKKQPGRRGVML